jgi:hypothetical protein
MALRIKGSAGEATPRLNHSIAIRRRPDRVACSKLLAPATITVARLNVTLIANAPASYSYSLRGPPEIENSLPRLRPARRRLNLNRRAFDATLTAAGIYAPFVLPIYPCALMLPAIRPSLLHKSAAQMSRMAADPALAMFHGDCTKDGRTVHFWAVQPRQEPSQVEQTIASRTGAGSLKGRPFKLVSFPVAGRGRPRIPAITGGIRRAA